MNCRVVMIFASLLSLVLSGSVCAQNQSAGADSVEFISFGDMDQWMTREIEESMIIGGGIKVLYEVAPKAHIRSNEPYNNSGGSPWATSNVMAKVSGVTKTNASVFPVEHEGGYAAHLVTRVESVKVLGFIDIEVLAAGSLYLGSVIEPIKSAKNPYSVINFGVPFTKRPKAICYDYKVELSGEKGSVRMKGFGGVDKLEQMDKPIAVVLLQKRWETARGEIKAERVGTYVIEYSENCDWQKDARYDIIYGNATRHPSYIDSMGLNYVERYALNSVGECVPIEEVGWADDIDQPTHMIVQFASSNGGAYVGSPGNQMWVDNVRLVY